MDHVLYFVAAAARAPAAEAALAAAGRRSSPSRAAHIRVAQEHSPLRTLAKLRSGAADALVVDARGEVGPVDESTSLGLLRALFDEHALATPIARERTFLVVDTDPRGAELAFHAGRMRLGGVLAGGEDDLPRAIWESIVATVSRARSGKIALCLAGGGTEGLFYELGVLRALSRFLPDFDLCDVDIVCGISAGAVVGALLANGVGPDELARALKGGDRRPESTRLQPRLDKGEVASRRLDPIRRSDLFDPALGALAVRAARLSWDVLRGRRSPLSALFRLPPAGAFAGKRLKRWMKRQLEKPGMTDDFSCLRHRLFIGATDQDSNEHVVFGAPGAPEVPIHVAVRASTALAPFYAPEKIHDRYYIDGGFTRTTNMRVAVQEGATLVILVDPLVPVSSARPGHVQERGGIFVAMQGLKSLINGRFDKAVPTLRAMYPHVAFHLFQPGEGARRVMGGSPMKYFYREEIEEIAFRETTREIRSARFDQLVRDFGRHGVRFVDPDEQPSVDTTEDEVRVVA
ncbi:MAG: patatin-like phospholipase family protein [Polyangiaceae bacterium]